MVHVQATLQHYLFEVSIAKRIAKIPAHTEQNEVGLEMTPFKRILAVMAHEGDLFRSFLSTVPDQHPFLQHNLFAGIASDSHHHIKQQRLLGQRGLTIGRAHSLDHLTASGIAQGCGWARHRYFSPHETHSPSQVTKRMQESRLECFLSSRLFQACDDFGFLQWL
jgi:hypothetical protein